MSEHIELEDAITSAIRRIVRAVDVQSRQLAASSGLTGPQLVTLRAIERLGPVSLSLLAKEVSLGQATITGILDRLERPGLVTRTRDRQDRRKVTVSVTGKGIEALRGAPPVLQDGFRRELQKLEPWEQRSMLAALERVARMMNADRHRLEHPELRPPA